MLTGFSWQDPNYLHLLWLAPAFVGVLAWLELRGRETLSRFVSSEMQGRLADRIGTGRRIARLLLIGGFVAAAAAALAGPQSRGRLEVVDGGPTAAQIMVAVDVSKSMLATDAAPNRLSRAKAEVSDLVDRLGKHRFGLLVFAGGASIITPITDDHDVLKSDLRQAGPQSLPRGGTRIGDAIRKSIAGYRGRGARVLLLITDGEDHDSNPKVAAEAARDAGIRIIAVGFGSEQGSEISIADPKTGARTKIKDADGKPVVSKLDGDTLREIVKVTEGAYVPAGTAALDLDSIVRDRIRPMLIDASSQGQRRIPAPLYPWFVLLSLVCFMGAVWLSTLPTRREA